MAVVYIPSLMRDLTGGREKAEGPGRTVGEVIESLERAFPGVRARLCEGDRLKPGLAVLVDGHSGRLGLLEPVDEHSEIRFVPAVSGG